MGYGGVQYARVPTHDPPHDSPPLALRPATPSLSCRWPVILLASLAVLLVLAQSSNHKAVSKSTTLPPRPAPPQLHASSEQNRLAKDFEASPPPPPPAPSATSPLRRSKPVVYSQEQLYGAGLFDESNRAWLRGIRPAVVAEERPSIGIDLDYGIIRAPGPGRKKLKGKPWKRMKPQELRSFNPSIATAPADLCPRCAYIVAVRADALHQCSRAGALIRDPFKSTAIVVLDASLAILRWTWFLNEPGYQIARVTSFGNDSRARLWRVPLGVSDDFAPPWTRPVFDVRLLNLDGRLFATMMCTACKFSIAQLHLSAEPTADGGLARLRAWASQRQKPEGTWIQGRNQALFAHSEGPDRPTELMVQPWLHLVGSLGAPAFQMMRQQHVLEPDGTTIWLDEVSNSVRRMSWHRAIETRDSLDQRRQAWRKRDGAERFGRLRLLGNQTGLLDQLWRRHLSDRATGDSPRLSSEPRLSLTTNLLRISRRAEGAEASECVAYLGIGHAHRGDGKDAREWRAGSRPGEEDQAGKTKASSQPGSAFRFGYRYTHFLYALQPRAPFQVLATSGEFCLAAAQDPRDCESIQFISGMAHALHSTSPAEPGVVVSYGINDCEARLGVLPLRSIWEMLRPLQADGQVCATV